MSEKIVTFEDVGKMIFTAKKLSNTDNLVILVGEETMYQLRADENYMRYVDCTGSTIMGYELVITIKNQLRALARVN